MRRCRGGPVCVLTSRERPKIRGLLLSGGVFIFISLLLEVGGETETVADINALFPLILLIPRSKVQMSTRDIHFRAQWTLILHCDCDHRIPARVSEAATAVVLNVRDASAAPWGFVRNAHYRAPSQSC